MFWYTYNPPPTLAWPFHTEQWGAERNNSPNATAAHGHMVLSNLAGFPFGSFLLYNYGQQAKGHQVKLFISQHSKHLNLGLLLLVCGMLIRTLTGNQVHR